MSKLRSVSTSFWSDPFIEELTPEEKLLYLYLITNEKTNMLGIYEVSYRKISFETGISIENLKKAFERFETLNKIKYQHNHVFLLNFLKHQNFNTNMKKSAIDCYNNLPKELKQNDLDINKEDVNKGFERLCKGFGMVRKVEVEYEVEDEKERESEVENKILHPLEKLELKPITDKFITWFNEMRVYHKLTGNIKFLTNDEINNLIELRKHYETKDFERAFSSMMQDEYIKNNTKLITPSHFLKVENFTKYVA